MRGHDHIVKLRKSGFRPSSVFLWDCPVQIEQPAWIEDLRFMEVCTHGDSIGSLDLRFLVGLPVTVIGDDQTRVQQIASQCRKAGAENIVAQCGQRMAFWKQGDKKWQSF